MALDAKTAKSISQQISKISAGVSKLSQAKSKGMKISSSSSVQDAERYLGGGKSEILDTPRGVGGRIDRNTGEVSNLRNSAGPLALSDVQMEGTDPNALAPQSMIDQRDQLESQVGNLAKSKGLTLKKTPQGGYTTTPDLASQYRQGLDNVMGSGVDAPDSGGLGSLGVNNALKGLGQETEPESILGGVMEVDNSFDSILTNFDAYFESNNQKTSLVKEYQKMSKSLGIEELNEEIIDAKRIIEGTEDDIRAEVTATGGFATESQVQALSNARNKSLLKNYQMLVDTRDNAMTQLNTMMDLSVQDRQFAEAEFDRKLNFAFKVQEFKERATTNAREGLKWAITNGAGSEILKSPYETRLVEKTLGLGTGGLAGIVAQQQLDVRAKEADIANTYSQIAERGAGSAGTGVTLSGKPQTTAQASANGYADRLSEADLIISSIGGNFTSMGSFGGLLPSSLQSEERQKYEQAKRNFVNAVLRRESGAAISPTEFSSAEKQYFPQAGDKPGVIEQKAANRNTVINNVYREADVKRPVFPGQIIESEGKKYKVDSDGETLIAI